MGLAVGGMMKLSWSKRLDTNSDVNLVYGSSGNIDGRKMGDIDKNHKI